MIVYINIFDKETNGIIFTNIRYKRQTMKVITIINQKGGVGKKHYSAGIRQHYKLQGESVLFIDLDAQGNISHTRGDTAGYNFRDPKAPRNGRERN